MFTAPKLSYCPCCGGMLDGENWAELVQWFNLIGIDLALDGAMTTKAAARYLGRSPQTLKNWRSLGNGPTYSKDGKGRVRYCVEDLEAFRQGGSDLWGNKEGDLIEYSMTPLSANYMGPKG